MPSADIIDGLPVFDPDGTQGGQSVFTFEPPVVREATRASWPARIGFSRGISVLKSGSSYRQVRVPTTDEVEAADIAYIGGGVYPVEESEAEALTDAGYGDRITEEVTGGGVTTTGVTVVDGVLFPYVDSEGAEPDEQAELAIVDGFPVFTY